MERRSFDRVRVWFPMAVLTDDGEENTAIAYDVSPTGLRMACPGALPAGSHVRLRFREAPDEPEETTVAGRVVRCEENAGAFQGPWRWTMAVRFDETHPRLEGMLDRWQDRGEH